MISIVNKGGTDPDPMGERQYELRINGGLIATFEHTRRAGLGDCLRKAATAADGVAAQAMYDRLKAICKGEGT